MAALAASLSLTGTDSLWAQNGAVGSGVRRAAQPRHLAQSPPQSAPALSPIQEFHRRAYYEAIQAGYNPSQAKAHADSVVQNAIASQQQQQQQQQAPRSPYPPQVQQVQQWEQQRIASQHQMAAAQQNARLWESVQRQRGVIAQAPRQASAAPQDGSTAPSARSQAAAPATMVPSVTDDSELRGVRAASAQLAKMHARSERIDSAVESPLPVEPVMPPARLVGTPRNSAPPTQPRSVLESTVDMELPGPQAAGAIPAGPPQTETSVQPIPAPSSLAPGTPRAPRKLPNVDPKPLQRQPSPLEVELEGFTDELLQNDGSEDRSSLSNQQVGYQQPIQSPSYARQDYVPSLGQPAPSAPSQLVELPSLPSPQASVHGFSVEPVPTRVEPTLPARSASPMNAQWDDQSPEFHVPPPTGIRVNPVSSGGRRAGIRRDDFQDDAANGLQDQTDVVPLPRSNNQTTPQLDDVEYGVGMKSCDQLRRELLGIRLSDISLDLATPASTLPPSEVSAEVREWRNAQNQVIARGRAVSANGQVIRIVENGVERDLPLANLSPADQRMAWQIMDLPFECEFLGTEAYCRSFAPAHVAWHASNLCHKPLYFEDIQLERYGHTVGPIKQPVKSAAKFLVQAALLPYQMALYPPNECQYPLGLFRPGNCAPYLRTPFPWERRAIGYQAGVTTGLFLLVP